MSTDTIDNKRAVIPPQMAPKKSPKAMKAAKVPKPVIKKPLKVSKLVAKSVPMKSVAKHAVAMKRAAGCDDKPIAKKVRPREHDLIHVAKSMAS